MPDEATSPAAVAEAPVTESAPAPAEITPAPEAPATVEAPKPTEPDYESLLAKDDVVDRLLQHPRAQQRLRSVREADVDRRAAEKAEELLRQRDAQYAQQRQQEQALEQRRRDIQDELRLIEEDPTHPLAQRRKSALEAEMRQISDADVRQRVRGELAVEARREAAKAAGEWWLDMLAKQVTEDDTLTDEERAGLNPRDPKWKTPGDFFTAWRKVSSSKEAQKLAKDMAKVEAEAIVQERLVEKRNGERAPVVLPPGGGVMNDEQFLADYAAGGNNDHARAMRLTGLKR